LAVLGVVQIPLVGVRLRQVPLAIISKPGIGPAPLARTIALPIMPFAPSTRTLIVNSL